MAASAFDVPLRQCIRAPDDGGGAASPDLVILTHGEEETCGAAVDVAFALGGRSNPEDFAASLRQAIAHVPVVAGRLVRRRMDFADPGEAPQDQVRVCILCDNSGVYFDPETRPGKVPSFWGPLTDSCFDRATGLLPEGTGNSRGGPLLRIRMLSYEDGQVLSLSFARPLSDIAGISSFLRVWACLHRGADPGPRLTTDRVALYALIRDIDYRPQREFTLLHRRASGNARGSAEAPLEEAGVACFVLDPAGVDAFCEESSQRSRRARHIFNTDVLTPAEAAIGAVAEAMGEKVPACLWVDFRSCYNLEFDADLHVGSVVSGLIDIDLPGNAAEAPAVIRKRVKVTNCREFWPWKLSLPNESLDTSRLVMTNWIGSLKLEEVDFGGDVQPTGVTLSEGFWHDWYSTYGQIGVGRVMVLPFSSKGHMQAMALLPGHAVRKLYKMQKCRVLAM